MSTVTTDFINLKAIPSHKIFRKNKTHQNKFHIVARE